VCVCVCVCSFAFVCVFVQVCVCARVRVGSRLANAPIVSTHFLLDVSAEVDDGSVWSARNATELPSSNVASKSSGACSVNTTTYDAPVVLSATWIVANLLSKLRRGSNGAAAHQRVY